MINDMRSINKPANDMRSIDKPANDMRSIDKPANDMRSIDKPSDRPSKCGVFDKEPFSEFERHQLDIPIAWSPCHLPRQQEISTLTPIERLWAVQQTLEAFQFDSIADALLLELKVGGRKSVGVGKRTSRFFTNGKCVELLTAIVQHRKFALDDLLQQDNFVGVVSRLFKRISDAEMEKVTKSQVLQQGLVNFRPELFENNDIFNDIEREQKQHAPILTGVIQTIARVDKGRKDSSNTETEQPDIQDGISQRKVLKALRNRRLISIISIQMLAYARKKSCNVMQGVLGVFLYATNTSKRTLETLHQCGLCVSYDAVLKAMRLTAARSQETLLKRVQSERYLISYDNMNFYHNTTAQRLHNRSYQVNYTAGYILFMGISAPLPSTSVNYQHVFDTKVDDILPDDELQLYIQCAAEHEIGKSLLRYCRRSMNSQQDGRKPKYHITPSPLAHMRANKNRADYMTFPTIDENEASINGTIAILKQIIDMLGLNSRDVLDSVLWISGDYLTVRNIARAIYRRQEHRERIHNFSFIEPIAGLFHLQMNALKMIMHAFDGAGGDPGSLRRFAALLRRKTVGKDVKDFHGSNEFFNHVLDAHILACLMKEIKAKTLAELHQWLRQNNWPNAIAKISREYGDPYIVQTRYSAMIDSVETQMEERMKQVLDNRAALKAARVAERQSTGRNAEPLPSFDRKKEESRILKELSGGMWDVVWQNAALLVVAGLVYRDFSEACKGGYSGRVEKCIQTLMLMFQGSRSSNYAAECLHLVVSLKRVWQPEFKKAWLDFCLIKPTPKEDYWCATDRHGETVIRGNKDKVRPSANAKGDEFLRNVIGPNIPALEAVKHMVYTASGSSNYRTHHHIVDAYADVAQVCAALVEEEVFTFKAGRGGSAGESVSYSPDLWCQGLEKVSNAAPLKAYKLKARGCWTSGTVVDWENEPLDSLEGEVGVMENGEDEEH